jgi:peptidoglycan hydrolase FlgJ
MNVLSVSAADMTASTSSASAASARTSADPEKIGKAAQQFEALMIGQMMRTMRESGSGWFGSGESGAGDAATEFAEQQFAQALASAGGLGLAATVSAGLKQQS